MPYKVRHIDFASNEGHENLNAVSSAFSCFWLTLYGISAVALRAGTVNREISQMPDKTLKKRWLVIYQFLKH